MKRRLLLWGASGSALLALVILVIWVVAREEGQPQPAQAEGSGMDMGGMQMDAEGAVRIDPDVARSLGITIVEAELGPLRREIRTTGNVTFDETRLSTVTPKFGGFVERLHVNFTGQAVRRGQPLLEIYSPELVSAQEELLSAVRLERSLSESAIPGVAERSGALTDAARRRLLLWDITAEQIERIESTGRVRRTLTMHAPFTGLVIEMNVRDGQSVQPGEILYRLADLSRVWVEADVFEQDLRFVQLGGRVQVEIGAYPGTRFEGRVSYVYPEVRADSRTGRVRVNIPNADGRIKPGMFATVYLDAATVERAVLLPRDAVMHTGTRDLVFVAEASGTYERREVQVGAEAGDRVQILSGLLAGERVVARANFILDSESRLMQTMLRQPGIPGMDEMGDGMDMKGMDMPGRRQ